eukprot:gb/GEZN01008795.1/.p1 GENE.gb/GEZN01008795.1/~~gb/GEZN01008795.1/.p1  ORF type:complete len:357 (-),score=65.69 gb/GEZN01008795.1/:320-1291(-)
MFSSTVPAPTLPQPLSSTPFLSSTSSTTTTSSSSSSSFSSSSCFSSSCLSTPAASLLACLGCSRKRCAGSCFPPCLLEHAGTTAAGPVGARLRKGTLLAALELLARRLGWAYTYNRLLCQRLPAHLSRCKDAVGFAVLLRAVGVLARMGLHLDPAATGAALQQTTAFLSSFLLRSPLSSSPPPPYAVQCAAASSLSEILCPSLVLFPPSPSFSATSGSSPSNGQICADHSGERQLILDWCERLPPTLRCEHVLGKSLWRRLEILRATQVTTASTNTNIMGATEIAATTINTIDTGTYISTAADTVDTTAHPIRQVCIMAGKTT